MSISQSWSPVNRAWCMPTIVEGESCCHAVCGDWRYGNVFGKFKSNLWYCPLARKQFLVQLANVKSTRSPCRNTISFCCCDGACVCTHWLVSVTIMRAMYLCRLSAFTSSCVFGLLTPLLAVVWLLSQPTSSSTAEILLSFSVGIAALTVVTLLLDVTVGLHTWILQCNVHVSDSRARVTSDNGNSPNSPVEHEKPSTQPSAEVFNASSDTQIISPTCSSSSSASSELNGCNTSNTYMKWQFKLNQISDFTIYNRSLPVWRQRVDLSNTSEAHMWTPIWYPRCSRSIFSMFPCRRDQSDMPASNATTSHVVPMISLVSGNKMKIPFYFNMNHSNAIVLLLTAAASRDAACVWCDATTPWKTCHECIQLLVRLTDNCQLHKNDSDFHLFHDVSGLAKLQTWKQNK